MKVKLPTTRNLKLHVKLEFFTIPKGPFLRAKVGTNRRALSVLNTFKKWPCLYSYGNQSIFNLQNPVIIQYSISLFLLNANFNTYEYCGKLLQ